MRFKNLGRYQTGGSGNKLELAIPLPTTPNGRVYRFSPNESAHPRHFVLGAAAPEFEVTEAARARMKLPPRSSQTVCPYSGTIADDSDFTHPDDLEAAKEVVQHAVVADLEAELGKIFGAFNSSQSRDSLLRIEANVEQKYRPAPRFSRDDLLRDLVCDHCGRDYGVFAIALFCPDCGAPNLRLHFAREVEIVRQQVDLASAQTDANHELAYRLLGNAHEDVLTAFEATQKTVYLYGVSQRGEQAKPVKNDFQNVEIAQRRFSELGIDPFCCLHPDDLATLKLNIQKRHIIGHNLGLVDAKFAEHAEDARVGETVQIVGDDVRRFAALAERVVAELDSWLAGGSPSPVAIGEALLPSPKVREMDLDKQLRSRAAELKVSPLAVRLGRWIALKSETGLEYEFVSQEALLNEFANVGLAEMEEAIAELQMDGLVQCTSHGGGLPHIRPKTDLFVTFDAETLGSNPSEDAVQLAKLVLEQGDSVSASALHEASAWSRRRFNPALAIVLAQIDDRHVSKTLDSASRAHSFFMTAEDRVSIKRFIAR